MIENVLKLHPDTIQEAILEVRFNHNELSELVVGLLAGSEPWQSFLKSRMPVSEIPIEIRENDPNLRHLPTVEFRNPEGTELYRFGSRTISCHTINGYIGWENFLPKLLAMANVIFEKIPAVKIERVGLRYINFPSKADHDIGGVDDLNLKIEVAGKPSGNEISLAYPLQETDEIDGLVRIMSPKFLANAESFKGSAVIDIDVFTKTAHTPQNLNEIEDWLNRAHDSEKAAFFNLLTPETIEKLRVK